MTPEEWYRTLPPVTKIWWTGAIVATILATLGVLNPLWIMMDYDLAFGKFHVWRLLTNFFFFGGFSMPFIFNVVLLVRYSGMLEEKFGRDVHGTAAMLTMMTFSVVATMFLGWLINPRELFYGHTLLFVVIYVWSRSDPFAEVNFYGFSFRQWHTPFLILLMGILFGGDPKQNLIGIFIGHLYYFLTDLVPRNYGKTLLWTPEFAVDGVKWAQAKWEGTPPPVNSAAPRPNWQQGQGHRLG